METETLGNRFISLSKGSVRHFNKIVAKFMVFHGEEGGISAKKPVGVGESQMRILFRITFRLTSTHYPL